MKILHLDIETAPHKVYSWGLWGQDISIKNIIEPGYTMCWAAKWHGKREIMFDSMHESSHKKMIKTIYDLINQADVVCHYNGTKFDMPTLNSEFIKYRLDPPNLYAEIDLLKTVRRRFRYPSNKLDYISGLFDLGNKTKHMGMDLWKACMEGDEQAWKIMKKYNRQDVNLLEKVYRHLLPWIPNHPNWGLHKEDHGSYVCRNCGSSNMKRNGFYYAATTTYQRIKCTSCGWQGKLRTQASKPPEGLTK
jgi:DNA polymerase elongation subunit (family B)/predicted RNA-binding Zn-ribbon protein involved in translation (DUF1610 family)